MVAFPKIKGTVLTESAPNAATYINEDVNNYGACRVRCLERRTSEPGSPVEGDNYLVGPTSTWPGSHLNELACRQNATWSYVAPTIGLRTFMGAQNGHILYKTSPNAGWCWTNQGPTGYTVLSSAGTYAVDFVDTNNRCFSVTATGTYTLQSVASPVMSMGVLYTIQVRNSSAGNVTISFPNTYWRLLSPTGFVVSTGNFLVARIKYLGAVVSNPWIVSVYGNITPP